MAGGVGNDIYVVDSASDVVTEASGAGTDEVRTALSSYTLGTNVENYTHTGSSSATGIGNTLANRLTGSSAANVLDGGAANDVLIGGAGADTFVFSTALSSNVDAVSDFSVVDDTIRLSSSVFTGLSTGTLSSAAFVIGAAAADSSDRIIYNASTGALLFDRDGTGSTYSAVQFATVTTNLSMTNGDFLVA